MEIDLKHNEHFKWQILNWANRFKIFCFLDSNNYWGDHSFDWMLGAGVKDSFTFSDAESLDAFKKYQQEKARWLMGHVSFDLQAETEREFSSHIPFIDFGVGFFFEPEHLIRCKDGIVEVIASSINEQELFNQILDSPKSFIPNQPQLEKIREDGFDRYLQAFETIQAHIKRGDCYELNFCRFFEAEEYELNPLSVYHQLCNHTTAPFSAVYKLEDKWCLCASPERYIQKQGMRLISQPMKGTAPRFLEDKKADENSRMELKLNEKEIIENVMIVDLVRNDLSRIAHRGTVHVPEMFTVLPYGHVWQMISTVEAQVSKNLTLAEALKASFPMGSMTGAPKRRVLQITNTLEPAARGLFSGSIGYITPNGDFDMNVVIRSIFYDKVARRMAFMAGSAITAASTAIGEFEECNLKVKGMLRSLA